MRIQVVKDLELVVRPGSYAVRTAPQTMHERGSNFCDQDSTYQTVNPMHMLSLEAHLGLCYFWHCMVRSPRALSSV